jgi:glycosyltransferase involved in cell wall biosynthesis
MMQAGCVSEKSPIKDDGTVDPAKPQAQTDLEVGLLTGCRDKHYVYGLVMALASKDIYLDLIGGDEVDSPDFHGVAKLRFLNLLGIQHPETILARKLFDVLGYYVRLIRYAFTAKPRVFHILWNNKFDFFDRTALMMYYKLLGKKIAFTAHNVNAGQRDSNDSLFNRLTLKIQYRLADHIFVHTEQMKAGLLTEFGVPGGAVTVIPFGINNAVPCTNLTPTDAKRRLGLADGERTILFFGNIGPYKGLDYLVTSFQRLSDRNGQYRLIIAGKPRGGAEAYVNEIREATSRDVGRGRVIQRIEHIPDQETELYFKAADVLVLPYTYIFQSGVLFLGYSFGLPVIATDVGSLREDIVEGETGFLCRPSDPADLARTIETYFESDLFKNLSSRRQQIRDYANERHSWDVVGELTRNVYAELSRGNGSKAYASNPAPRD